MDAVEVETTDEGSVPLVRAVQRAMAILRSFEGEGPLSLAEVTQRTGLDKGTTRRLLLTLMAEGFVVQEARSGRYGLGPAVRALAASVAGAPDLRDIAAPLLSELAAELHITAFLSVFRDGEAVCLDRVHDMKGMEVRWWAVGGTLPINCGGAPKVLLAFQSPDEIDRCLMRPLTTLTPRSVTDPALLRQKLDVIRARGWDVAIDDVAVGLTALAVPVLARDGTAQCCVSIAGLTPQMVARGRPIHLARLQAIARRIAAQLG